jgi:hypothetical protein
MIGWERPAAIGKGLTIAYQVVTPSSELRTTKDTYSGVDVTAMRLAIPCEAGGGTVGRL